MSRTWSTIALERSGDIVRLTLDRPTVLNAYDRQMRDELFAALSFVRDDSSVRVLVVAGRGRAFSSGGDLREFGTAPSPWRAREIRHLRDVWQLWATLPCPTIAEVHGIAAGGGLEMALLCDIVICAADARLFLPETGLGLVPGVGGTQTLARLGGPALAGWLLLAGAEISGREAARRGLVAAAVPAARLAAHVRARARELARFEPDALRAMKAALSRGDDLPLRTGLALEQRLARTLTLAAVAGPAQGAAPPSRLRRAAGAASRRSPEGQHDQVPASPLRQDAGGGSLHAPEGREDPVAASRLPRDAGRGSRHVPEGPHDNEPAAPLRRGAGVAKGGRRGPGPRAEGR